MFLSVFMDVYDYQSQEVEGNKNVLKAGVSKAQQLRSKLFHFLVEDLN